MKLIVSCLVSIMMLFNVSFALPNGNNLFQTSHFVSWGLINGHNEIIDVIDEEAVDPLSTVLSVVYSIGLVIAVVVASILAIKLLFTTPAKKAEVKAAFMPYLIGLLLVIGGVPIATMVIRFFTKLL